MSLEKAVVSVPLIDGLSDNDDNFASDPPGMIEIAEARWSRDKQIGKRNGISITNEPGDGTAVVAAKGLNNIVDHDGFAHAITTDGTFRQQPDASLATWAALNTGSPRATRVLTDPIVRQALSCNKSDAAIAGDVVCAVWEQDDSLGGVAAYYGFWNVADDAAAAISGPSSFVSITNAVRVVSLAGRYFVITGLGGNGNLFSCAYDTHANTWTVGTETSVGSIDASAHQYALAPDYTQTAYAYLCYLDVAGLSRAIKRLDVTGAVVATKGIPAAGVQHILHNGPLSKLVVISETGVIDYVADSMSGAVTTVTPFTPPASGAFTSYWCRASIGLVDTTGKMWAARSTGTPRSSGSVRKAYGTQVLQLSTSFVPSYENLIGGVQLAAHFSPVITETGVSYVGVAHQGAWYTEDTNLDPTGSVKHIEAYKAAPVGFVVHLAVDGSSLTQLMLCARYGQDTIEFFGNGEVGSPLVQPTSPTSHLPHLAYDLNAPSTGRRMVSAYPIRSADLISGGGGYYRRSVDLVRVETHDTTPIRNVTAQGIRCLGSGHGTSMIDGVDHAEMTPPCPEWVAFDGYDPNSFGNSYSFSGTVPPNIQGHIDWTGYPFPGGMPSGPNPNNQWAFVVVWEYIDAKGNLHRGPPSSICYSILSDLVGQIGGEGSADHGGKLVFSPWRPISILGDKDIQVTSAIYACPPDGGGDFRKIGTVVPLVDPDNEGQVFVTVTNGGTVLSNSVELHAWDFTRPVPETLYTSALGAGELSTWPSPALLSICSTQSRLWGLNGEDRLDVWYTKPLAKGIAPEWNDTLRVRIPQEGGPSVGIAALDDKVVVFKRTKVFIIEGDGGDAAGNASSIRPPRLVSSDIGCDSVESIVEGPFGVMFHSERGFFTLGRDLQYQFVGAPVMDQLTAASSDGLTRIITSACIIPSEAEVRFTLDTARGAGNQRGLAWNYRLNRWTRRDAISPTMIANVDGIEWSAIADVTGNSIWKETPLSWASTPGVGLTFRTSWIKLNGIAGFGRLWRAVFLLRWFANGIRIRTSQDYQTETETWKTWTSTQLAALADSSGRVELDIRPTVQKCEAVQFLVQEYEGQGITSGRGFELIGVTLEAGVKRGAFKRIASGGRK